MNVEQIMSLGPQLARYLDEYADCFGRAEPRGHLMTYVRGQLLDWQSKVNDLKGVMVRSETRIDQKQAELEAAVASALRFFFK